MVHAFVIEDLFDLFLGAGGQDFRPWLEAKALQIQLQFVGKDGKRIDFCLALLFPGEELILPLGFVESRGEVAQGLFDIGEFLVYFGVADGGLRELFGGLEALAG